ncbi:MAG: hypothetical protein J7L54_02765 [Elusimicrobia bacterium]|nr:hypothetical protein [Elusimicrobiota bacterium]
MLKKTVFLIILTVVFSSVCGAAVKKVRSSSRHRPKWLVKLPQEKGYNYFLGIAQNQPDKGVALEKAISEALKQVLTTIGIVVGTKMRINKEMTADKTITRMLDEYRETGKAKVRGHKIKGIYTEEFVDGDKRFFDVYVLLRYSDRQIKAERRRIEQRQAATRRLARAKMPEIDIMIEKGMVMDAYLSAAQIFTDLADQPTSGEYRIVLGKLKKIINGIGLEAINLKGKKPKVKATLRWDGSEIPVDMLKLEAEFSSGAGEIQTPQKTTGGTAEFKIEKAAFQGGILKLKIFPPPDQFLNPLENAYMDSSDFSFLKKNIDDMAISVILKAADFGGRKYCLLVWDERGRRQDSFEVSLTKNLTNAGISVRTFSRIPSGVNFRNFEDENFYGFLRKQEIGGLIVGELKIVDNGSVYNLRSVSANISLKVIDIKNRKVLAAFEKTQTGVQINFERAKIKTTAELVKKIAPQIIDIATVQ